MVAPQDPAPAADRTAADAATPRRRSRRLAAARRARPSSPPPSSPVTPCRTASRRRRPSRRSRLRTSTAEAGPATERPPAHRTYREQVETELQRILDDAGLHTEVDGILADAKAEAQRQGVPIDSELMLRALCEDTNGAAKLSDSAKGELESRFKRIVAEERGERGPTPGSQPPRG